MFDLDYARAERFAHEFTQEPCIEARPIRELATAVRKSDICVTCTLSRQYYVSREIVAPGTFTAAVGVNNEEKQELNPLMFVERKIVVNLLEQAMRDH